MKTTTRAAKLARNFIRSLVGASRTMSIEIIPGDDAPKLEGSKPHFETPSGSIVRWPNAYRRAFGKPIYVASSLRLAVGEGWLKQAEKAAMALR